MFALLFKETDNADDYEVFAPWFDASINEVDSFDLKYDNDMILASSWRSFQTNLFITTTAA